MFDHWRCLPIEHGVIPILMKKGPKSLIHDPLLTEVVAWPTLESDGIPQILLVVVNFFPVDVTVRGMDLQALKLIGRFRSATTRRRVLGGGLLLEGDGSCPLASFFG
jgi:hypothetical protein